MLERDVSGKLAKSCGVEVADLVATKWICWRRLNIEEKVWMGLHDRFSLFCHVKGPIVSFPEPLMLVCLGFYSFHFILKFSFLQAIPL